MKLSVEISFYIFIGLAMYISDNRYQSCKKPVRSHVSLLIHQILANFLLFGIFSRNKDILTFYIATFFVVIFSQVISGGYCPLTTYVNKNCGVEKEEPLRDCLYYIGLKRNNIIYYISLCVFFSIVLYKWKRYKEK